MGPEQPADRGGADADADLAKLALDPHVAQARVLPGESSTQRRSISAPAGRAGYCSSGGGTRTHNLGINRSRPRPGPWSDHPLAAADASHASTSSHRYRR